MDNVHWMQHLNWWVVTIKHKDNETEEVVECSSTRRLINFRDLLRQFRCTWIRAIRQGNQRIKSRAEGG